MRADTFFQMSDTSCTLPELLLRSVTCTTLAELPLFMVASLTGLYSNKRLPLSDDTDELKVLGQPLQYWGNLDSKKFRHAYPSLRTYIFIALVAKTDIDWIALDKGEIKVGTVVSKLIETMEEYANYGFSFMEDKLNEDRGYFFSNRAFLDIFMQLTNNATYEPEPEDSPEEL